MKVKLLYTLEEAVMIKLGLPGSLNRLVCRGSSLAHPCNKRLAPHCKVYCLKILLWVEPPGIGSTSEY